MSHIDEHRKNSHDVDPIYIKRWSPRAFSNKPVDRNVLLSIFEAARWAPSAANKQPWRFIIAETEEDRERFLSFIYEGNTIWCHQVPVLAAILSKEHWDDVSGDRNKSHGFDAGAAWGYLALEAARQGLHTHAMGGFDQEQAKVALQVPEGYEIHAIIAIGYEGEKASLPERLRDREVPSNRHEVDTFISEGTFIEKL